MAVSCLLFLILLVVLRDVRAVVPADGGCLQYDAKKSYQLEYAPWAASGKVYGSRCLLLWGMKEVLRGGIPPGVLAIINE